MKHIVGILMIGLLFTACNNEGKQPKTDGYVITGTAKGIYNGVRVYLKTATDSRGRQIARDTAMVMNEQFEFKGKTEEPELMYLSVNGVMGFVPIMIENETIEVVFNKEDAKISKVTGTKSNDAISEYANGFTQLVDERNEINSQFSDTINSANPKSKDSILKELEYINMKISKYPIEFLKTHTDSYFSLSLLETILQGKPTNMDDISAVFSLFDSDIKKTRYGRSLEVEIEALRKKNESLAMLNIGKQAPDFSAPNPDGEQISLYDIKGKVTIIDFWASWCGPCRKENPNVVKVFNKYHKKGLEIISVSLDRPGQKDKWLKAIKDDKLTWHHVSNLNYFNDPVAQQYDIQAIPATFILDANGTIVAKSLRGQALEDKIAELLN